MNYESDPEYVREATYDELRQIVQVRQLVRLTPKRRDSLISYYDVPDLGVFKQLGRGSLYLTTRQPRTTT